MSLLPIPSKVLFGPFTVTTQVFYCTRLTYALVNLRPLVAGHVLIVPFSSKSRLSQLTSEEVTDLFSTVQRVSNMLERFYKASAFNIAIQDGKDAGQSVSHLHVHICPRRPGDYEKPDGLYADMEGDAGDVGAQLEAKDQQAGERPKFPRVVETDRKDRTIEQMVQEANELRKEMAKEIELEA
jgi:bis(5'-adenosyl)-triphosphatase